MDSYEKKYNEALDRAKEWLNIKEPFSDTCTCVVESIFPELKESEDEKIRKDIIYFLSRNTFQFGEDIDKYKSWIAWLEKQGESVKSRWKPSKEQLEAFNHFVRSIGESGYASPYDNNTKLLYSLLHDLEQLEKQNEQEPFDYENATIQQKDFAPKSVIEATNEEKIDNANKVKPKFKVGDWVVLTEGELSATLQIANVDINKELYWFNDDSYLPFADEGCLHLWSIDDAKAGDVLAFNDGHGNDCIELIKSITGKKIEFWFCLTNGDSYEVFDGITPYTNLASRGDATPATKEQRDTLERAMTNAGYRWNKEELKLEKI